MLDLSKKLSVLDEMVRYEIKMSSKFGTLKIICFFTKRFYMNKVLTKFDTNFSHAAETKDNKMK